MSEKLPIPLDLIPLELRHSIETILKKYAHLDQSPSSASSSKLGKLYEALKNSWQELRWEPFVNDLQQQAVSLQQQQAERPTIVQQQLQVARSNFDKRLQQQQQTLEQRQFALRDSMKATRKQLAEKQRLLNMTSPQLIEEQLVPYESEWTSAEARIKQQKTQLRQADNNYPNVLWQHKNGLQKTFNQKQHDLSEQQLALSTLQQQNSERRRAWADLLTTYTQEVGAKWDDYTGYCLSLQPCNANEPDLASWQISLGSMLTDLLTREAHLTERKQRLAGRQKPLLSTYSS